MGKKDKTKKGKGAEKTMAKTLKKQTNKLKKELAAKGEVIIRQYRQDGFLNFLLLLGRS